MGKAKRPARKTLKVTQQQADLLTARNAAVSAAQQRLNDALAGVVAGHGYVDVPVIGLDVKDLTITIELPEGEE